MSRWPVLILLAAAIVVPNFLFGPGLTDSQVYNYIWTAQFADAISAGEFYPRWLPDSFEGLGSPTFYFYPPFAFWVAGALDALGLTTLQAINAAGFLLLLASGLTMYVWLKSQGGRALLGAALYMVAPYHLLDLYSRGALAEFAAFVWLPLIALAIEALPKRWAPPLLAVSFAGLILSHLPTALLAGLFLIAPLAVRKVRQDRDALLPGLVAGALGLALCAFYLLPALTLQEHVSISLLWSDFYGPSHWRLDKASTLYLLSLAPIAPAMALLALPSRSFWAGVTVVAALAALQLIPVIWHIPLLAKVQFPWRLLAVVEFAAITAVSFRAPRRLWLKAALVLLAAPYLVNGIRAGRMLTAPRDYTSVNRVLPDAPEYLPRGFDVSAVGDRMRAVDLSPYRALPSPPTMVRSAGAITVRRFAFPIWRVEKEGIEVKSHGPLITFQATPGVYRVVRVRLWQERLGALVSLLAALSLLAMYPPAPAGPAKAHPRPRTAGTPS
ncbi:MAG TPA: hypothetical protein VF138_08410 [Caulobacteraceae bacterium]